MSYFERTSDVRDPVGAFASQIGGWVAQQRSELRMRWQTEPDMWSMANINKMQRKEEKREGGARKVEDAAVSNFKDLYARNAVSKAPKREPGEEDYSYDVDTMHGQI
jgi:hypothetical protein